jgi:uronate dehydrogenase
MPQYERILITGAGGRLGSELRKGFAPLATKAARSPVESLDTHEEQAVFTYPTWLPL